MMKRRRVLLGVFICIVLGMTACGKPAGKVPEKSEVTPTATVVPTKGPEATATVAPTEEPKATATAVPTEEPEATATVVPTEEPEATATVVPTEEPEATATAVPTEEPEATTTAVPTEEPEATATAVPTEEPEATATPEPTATPRPTATPKPTATPVPTPKPGAEVTVRFYAPLVLKDLNAIEATDALDFLNKLSVYAYPKNGTATETAMLNETASDYFRTAGESLMQNGVVSESAKECVDESATVSCNGWFDKNRSWYDSTYFIDKSNYYSNYSSKTFADLGIQKAEVLEVFATYTVKTEEGAKAYMPCILDVQLEMGFFKTTMTYMMAMPIWERIVLPELDGYTLEWVDNGMTMSLEKIRIYDETINHYTLVVKPK